jgi:NADPH:quinone reductase-like Zn-dependent oxidoreductase
VTPHALYVSRVDRIAVATLALSDFLVSCGILVCQIFVLIVSKGGAGGFSEYLVVSPENLYKLPKGLDIQIGGKWANRYATMEIY